MIDVSALSDAVLASDVLYPVLGLVVGRLAGDRVPVIVGLPPGLHEDRLKAIGASAASTGAVAMFHAVGSTPEAATLDDALQGEPPDAVIEVTARDCARRATSSRPRAPAPRSTPSASARRTRRPTSCARIVAALDGRAGQDPRLGQHRRATCSPRPGSRSALRDAGVTFVVDTCTYMAPVVARSAAP